MHGYVVSTNHTREFVLFKWFLSFERGFWILEFRGYRLGKFTPRSQDLTNPSCVILLCLYY
jgi:hypothetical protein